LSDHKAAREYFPIDSISLVRARPNAFLWLSDCRASQAQAKIYYCCPARNRKRRSICRRLLMQAPLSPDFPSPEKGPATTTPPAPQYRNHDQPLMSETPSEQRARSPPTCGDPQTPRSSGPIAGRTARGVSRTKRQGQTALQDLGGRARATRRDKTSLECACPLPLCPPFVCMQNPQINRPNVSASLRRLPSTVIKV